MLLNHSTAESLAEILQFELVHLQKLHFGMVPLDAVPFTAWLLILEAITMRPKVPTSTLTELLCQFDMNLPDFERLKEQLEGKFLGSESRTAITKLRLPHVFKPLPILFLEKFLGNCVPNLETFYNPKVSVEDAPRLGHLLALHCPKLIHWMGDHYPFERENDEGNVSALHSIRGCKGKGGGEGGEGGGVARLRSLHSRRFDSAEGVLDAILEHGPTLEQLVMIRIEKISNQDVQRILKSCPHLTTLAITGYSDMHSTLRFSDFSTGFIAQDMDERQIYGSRSKQLRTLRLTSVPGFVRGEGVFEDEVDMAALRIGEDGIETIPSKMSDKQIAKRVYSRIRHLLELEEVVIWFEEEGPDQIFYLPGEGYRGQGNGHLKEEMSKDGESSPLAGLKKLRRLFVTWDMWLAMTLVEV